MNADNKYVRFDWAVKRMLRNKATFWRIRRIDMNTREEL